jgi:D-aminoacyl-tRNA deacylase
VGGPRKGRRPSFDNAMKPELAEPEFNGLVSDIQSAASTVNIQTGIFRAHMKLMLTNDGPVTVYLDSREAR